MSVDDLLIAPGVQHILWNYIVMDSKRRRGDNVSACAKMTPGKKITLGEIVSSPSITSLAQVCARVITTGLKPIRRASKCQ